MDLILDKNSESVVKNLDEINYALLHVNSENSSNEKVSHEKDAKSSWKESSELNYIDETKFIPLTTHSLIQGLESSDENMIPASTSKTLENSLIDAVFKGPTQHQKGRASLVRLQAAQSSDSSQTSEFNSKITEASSFSQGLNSTETSSHNTDSSKLTNDSEGWSWPDICSVQCEEIQNADAFLSSSEAPREPEIVPSSYNTDEIPNSQEMQRFLTSDGQYVYGYKDSSGEFQYFFPTMSDRENHNEKERKRRSRVSEACNKLRSIVPGLSDKTDKASVFEHTAKYLKFLRDKYGTQFDQAYYDEVFCKLNMNV